MFSHIRKQHQVQREKEKSLAQSKSKKRVFGDFRWDYIKSCKHELGSDSCPLCKLTSSAVKQYFEEESKAKLIAKETSLYNRARLRYNLLQQWAVNQSSIRSDHLVGFVAEIGVCESVVQSLLYLSDYNQTNGSDDFLDFDELTLILDRRKRIREIGNFAATFLQARIRKMIAYKSVKRDILRRFELIPASRTREEFFLDCETHRQWRTYPRRFIHLRPASPSTIGRRIQAEDKRRESRFKSYMKYENSSAKKYSGGEDVMEREKVVLVHMKQLSILRDVCLSAMTSLTRLQFESEMRMMGLFDSAVESSVEAIRPVWISVSSPAPPAFQIGIAMALKSPYLADYRMEGHRHHRQSFDEGDDVNAPKPSREHRHSLDHGPGDASHGQVAKSNELNRALRRLEQIAWDNLNCRNPEDVVRFLLTADLHASLESACSFAKDESKVWNPELDFGGSLNRFEDSEDGSESLVHKVGLLQISSSKSVKLKKAQSFKLMETVEAVKCEQQLSEVLPVNFQIRPFVEGRGIFGLFRLFFYEAEYIAATHASPWVFYPEVFKNKDVILNSLKIFAQQPEIKAMVSSYFKRGLSRPVSPIGELMFPSSSPPQTGRRGSLQLPNLSLNSSASRRLSTPDLKEGESESREPRTLGDSGGGCVALYCPSHDLLLGQYGQELVQPTPLTDEDILRLHSQHVFLNKVSAWKSIAIRAQNNKMKRLQKQESTRNLSRKDVGDSMPIKQGSVHFPLAEDLIGTDLVANYYQKHSSESEVEKSGLVRAIAVKLKNYKDRLAFLSTTVNMNMKKRIQYVREPAHLNLGTSSPSPQYDLFVVEVFVDMRKSSVAVPANGRKPPSVPKPKEGTRISIVKESDASTPMKPKAAGSTDREARRSFESDGPGLKLDVSIHQVVGLFSLDSPRCPPILDLGLFDWEYFQLFKAEAEKSKLADIFSESKNRGLPKDRSWPRPDDITGQCIHKSKTLSGREQQLRIIGTIPSKSHLDKILPKKVKAWVGMF